MSLTERGPGVLELELAGGPPRPPAGAGPAYILLRWHGRPVGRVILGNGGPPDAAGFAREVLEAAGPGLVAARAAAPGDPFAPLAPPRPAAGGITAGDVSVVVATRDRPEPLARCLAELGRLDPPPAEVIVADSASRDPDAVAAVAAAAGARVVRLSRPGLSRARNGGWRAATGTVVAFLDDDILVDPGWLSALAAGFADEEVAAVTGQLLPLELETEAQRLFLAYFHMDRRGWMERRFAAAPAPSPHWPLDAWRMGSGGNMAARRGALERAGGFREDLGLGTAARGGEDLFLLWSLIRGGAAVVYRPDALAWHRHHREAEALGKVLFGYGAGHAAYLRAAREAGAPPRGARLYALSFYADRLLRLARSAAGLGPVPAGLVAREVWGHLAGGHLGRRAAREERTAGGTP